MLKIEWNGISSDEIQGLIICELPPITKPKMRTSITTIDGKDGSIVEELGYESYTKSILIGLTSNYDIDQIIKYFSGSGELIMSNEPDKKYLCRITDKVDYQKLLRFKTATVKFYTQPYKYLYNEEDTDVTIEEQTSITIRNQGNEKSRPKITLYGSGIVEISLNNITMFTYSFPEGENEVVIDCEKEEAYLNEILKNRNMFGGFPKLEPGNNNITWSGSLTRIKIKPNSRWI